MFFFIPSPAISQLNPHACMEPVWIQFVQRAISQMVFPVSTFTWKTCQQLGKNDTTVDGSEIRQTHQSRLVSYPYVFTRSLKKMLGGVDLSNENPRKIYSDLSVGWEPTPVGNWPSFRNSSEPNSPDFPHVFPTWFPTKNGGCCCCHLTSSHMGWSQQLPKLTQQGVFPVEVKVTKGNPSKWP